MQDIVRQARLSPGAIYRYFASKQDMVAAIASLRRAEEARVLREAEAAGDVREGLRRVAGAFLGRLSDPAEREWRRLTVQLWSEALRDQRVMRVVRQGLDAPLAVLRALLRRARREGRAPAGLDAGATARVAAAIFQGLVLQQAWQPRLDVAACARSARALLDAVVAARPAPTPRRRAPRRAVTPPPGRRPRSRH
jgi:AcrR family transcriptional regulator